MKTYQLITIPPRAEQTELRAVAVVCDLCGRTIKHLLEDGGEQLNREMVEQYGNAFIVKVEFDSGETNLDGGSGETTIFDICPYCFSNKLTSWLAHQGAEPRIDAWHR